MKWKRIAAFFLVAAVMLPSSALAHSHSWDIPARPILSEWAEQEVAAARALGFVQDALLPDDCREPMTRGAFAEMAMDFVAMQTRHDTMSLSGLIERYIVTPAGNQEAFRDGNDMLTRAYHIGLVEGRGDGTFGPEGLITRQEAAVMLTRAYQVYGGTLPEEVSVAAFSDVDAIADWAAPSVAALASWGVMQGVEGGNFAPEQHYSVEQCVVTLLRLYEHAPVSQKAGNAKALFTYDQCISYALRGSADSHKESLRIEGEEAIFLRIDLSGMMRATSSLYFVYKDGGLRHLDLGVCNEAWGFTPSQALDSPRFSEDGKTFQCSVVLEEDTVIYPDSAQEIVMHKAGTYHITIDVQSGACKQQLVALGTKNKLASFVWGAHSNGSN